MLFIKPENYTYVGPLPEDCHYAMDNKSSAVKEQLSTFLSAQRDEGKIFNFVEEIFKYCYNDVYILATSMGLFETEFEKITNVCLLEVSFRKNCTTQTLSGVYDCGISSCSSVSSKSFGFRKADCLGCETVSINECIRSQSKIFGMVRFERGCAAEHVNHVW